MRKIRREVVLGEELYAFTSLQSWIDNAHQWSEQCSVPTVHRVHIDTLGRICTTGSDFQRASVDCTYPIVVYSTDPMIRQSDSV